MMMPYFTCGRLTNEIDALSTDECDICWFSGVTLREDSAGYNACSKCSPAAFPELQDDDDNDDGDGDEEEEEDTEDEAPAVNTPTPDMFVRDGRWTTKADCMLPDRCPLCPYKGATLRTNPQGQLACSKCFPEGFPPIPK